MQKPSNWDSVEATGYGEEFKRLVPGGYVVRVETAEEVPEREYIKMTLDITEGEYKGYGSSCLERNGFNPLKFVRSYKPKALGMFKGFTNCVEANNPRYIWDWNPASLVGKSFGVILREEEYKKANGEVGTRLTVHRTINIADVRAGSFTVPDKKPLPQESPASAFTPIEDDGGNLPF